MAFYFPNQHDQIVKAVHDVLVAAGVPPNRILRNQQIVIPGWHQADADILVVGEDGKTIVWQIEAKVGGGIPETAYKQVRQAFSRVWGLYRCFVATSSDGKYFLRSVTEDDSDHMWTDLSDTKALANLLGDYQNESNRAIETANIRRKEVVGRQYERFTRNLWVVGLLLLIGAVVGECLGKEFSWKIYYVVTMIFAIYAAANGIAVHVKAGQWEAKICKQIAKEKKEDKEE